MTTGRTTGSRGGGLLLGLLLGGAARAWRKPWSRADEVVDLALYSDLTQQAEAAKLHTIFLADGVATDVADPQPGLEPVTLLSALAARTERIGLVGSVSTSFSAPYNVARQIASLDHISRGRAGWNIVTSAWGGENFGIELPPHDERYAIAEEFTRVVEELWSSWEPGAIVRDLERNLFVDPAKVRQIDWTSEHFSVRGPLNVPRTPQGRPILAQAGSSEAGKAFGARHADLIFTTGLVDLAESQELYDDVRKRAADAGRHPGSIKILPGVAPVIGSSDAEARRIWEESHEHLDLVRARESLSKQFGGIDLSGYEWDQPVLVSELPEEEAVEGRRSRYGVLRRLLATGELTTLRDLVLYHASAAGHWFPVGSVERVADALQERYESGAADGFNILPFFLEYPGGLDAVTEGLVPELQRRGLFHTEYEHETLRENLGLAPIDEETA
ncbi:NtaA/DmoA family FMN-dependent monooxygenase [Cellulosimicrobium cellulans]|uniref:NtaA/DmoA family FMN-dependent monooxygenase n=1 Tax=Cellulosimicrobium cellulans TaxID=1710 RepID=UPI002096E5AB|nr:NtaA/DmoA family FMN-dependent monooxygenase [Cellulosimicrobium cellulans]MCO7275374.1 NtaA/DmoA family FMN-dependent monooxygenase [Cellulosimicrobium cellulans]